MKKPNRSNRHSNLNPSRERLPHSFTKNWDKESLLKALQAADPNADHQLIADEAYDGRRRLFFHHLVVDEAMGSEPYVALLTVYAVNGEVRASQFRVTPQGAEAMLFASADIAKLSALNSLYLKAEERRRATMKELEELRAITDGFGMGVNVASTPSANVLANVTTVEPATRNVGAFSIDKNAKWFVELFNARQLEQLADKDFDDTVLAMTAAVGRGSLEDMAARLETMPTQVLVKIQSVMQDTVGVVNKKAKLNMLSQAVLKAVTSAASTPEAAEVKVQLQAAEEPEVEVQLQAAIEVDEEKTSLLLAGASLLSDEDRAILAGAGDVEDVKKALAAALLEGSAVDVGKRLKEQDLPVEVLQAALGLAQGGGIKSATTKIRHIERAMPRVETLSL